MKKHFHLHQQINIVKQLGKIGRLVFLALGVILVVWPQH
jgi:hypothetical protein